MFVVDSFVGLHLNDIEPRRNAFERYFDIIEHGVGVVFTEDCTPQGINDTYLCCMFGGERDCQLIGGWIGVEVDVFFGVYVVNGIGTVNPQCVIAAAGVDLYVLPGLVDGIVSGGTMAPADEDAATVRAGRIGESESGGRTIFDNYSLIAVALGI